jgi:hypothetical protein
MPDLILHNILDTTFHDFTKLKQIDCLIDTLDNEFVSVIILLIPEKSARKEVVNCHHGHEGIDYSNRIPTYEALVEKGYHVTILHMPLKGRSNMLTLNTSTSGRIKEFNHNILMYFEKPCPIFLRQLELQSIIYKKH